MTNTPSADTEVLPALNPVQALNEKVRAKKAEASQRLQKLRRERAAHEKAPPVIPANADPAQAARIEAAWQDERDRLRRAERNFSEVAILMELDDERGSKAALNKALDYLRQKHDVMNQASMAATAPDAAPKKTLGTAIASLFGDTSAEPAPTFPAPHRPPQGGLFGSPIFEPIEHDFRALTREVEAFPNHISFVRITEMVNALASRLHQAAPPPPMAVRQDKGWRVPPRM